MSAETLPMRQVREVLRLKHVCGHSERRIAAAVGISRYTVAEYPRRAAVVGITWPVPAELDDAALERNRFNPPNFIAAETTRLQPDWPRLHAELRRPGVTLLPLWEEYRAATATAGFAFSTPGGVAPCRRPSGKTIRSESGCSSTMPGKRWRSSTRSPIHASPLPSRVTSHGSGPMWFAIPSS
jgi:hypothetical protein